MDDDRIILPDVNDDIELPEVSPQEESSGVKEENPTDNVQPEPEPAQAEPPSPPPPEPDPCVSTPAGRVPKRYFIDLMACLAIGYPQESCQPENDLYPHILDYAIIPDLPEERVRYSEMIDAKNTGTEGKRHTTALKFHVESEVFKEYLNRFTKMDACKFYITREYPTVRSGVIGRLLNRNEVAQQTGMNERQLRAKEFNSIFSKK